MKSSLLLLLFFVLQPWGMAQAAGPNMFFSGTLVMPPCTISKGAKVEVDFGEDLGVNKIDGVNYTKPVDYTVDCDEDYVANQLAIVIETTSPTIFDPSAVATDKRAWHQGDDRHATSYFCPTNCCRRSHIPAGYQCRSG